MLLDAEHLAQPHPAVSLVVEDRAADGCQHRAVGDDAREQQAAVLLGEGLDDHGDLKAGPQSYRHHELVGGAVHLRAAGVDPVETGAVGEMVLHPVAQDSHEHLALRSVPDASVGKLVSGDIGGQMTHPLMLNQLGWSIRKCRLSASTSSATIRCHYILNNNICQ